MKHLPLILLAAFIAIYAASKYVPDLSKPDGPDMVAAFSKDATRSGVEAKHDALQFGALCEEMVNDLVFDWAQSESFIKSGSDVDNLRIISRKLTNKGGSYGEHYPALKGTLEQHFSKHVDSLYKPDEGTGGPLDEPKRQAWIRAFKELAECSKYAASKL